MVVSQHHRFKLHEKSFANLAKREITRIAESYGFSAADVGKVNIVVSELVSNLLKHTPEGGELLIKPVDKTGIEIISIDNGPGMADAHKMMRDGTSTSGTAGEGLGAIIRQSDEFDIYSRPDSGTIVLSRLYKAQRQTLNEIPARPKRFDVAVIMVPKLNETFCGDACAVVVDGNDCHMIALDGLGHGASANEASSLAAKSYLENYKFDPAANLRLIHDVIRKTRGAVGTAIHINASRKRISYCGIGNIAGKVFTTDGVALSNISSRNIIAYNGIIGHNVPTTFSTQQSDWNNNSLLILHSDGIRSRWDLSKYPNLHRHDASIIASVIYRDHARHTDDTLVAIVRPKV